ncbi:DNA repair protein RecN [Alkalibacillus salilacus]|uniref:DNA repair protein RecN n=1 Tax=Alkalibacillus salilacus TaxID=284582 RepID=A0ABT9VC79_9BACI|nr:DNA repair protein RecN [Alkalibacillus salilacus]MDQ0158578.1 DNA repair protein RecN (Recombination protein N) [Alkalibacillus salilacus]
MLAQITIKDFAIIDEVSLTFDDGLTVLTGETGAGKSIIIDAIQLLAGARASVEYVRHQAEQALIEGLFFIDSRSDSVQNLLEQFDVPVDYDEGSVVVERRITAKGKSICKVNGKLITLAVLKEIGRQLIDIHSQHETQSLMNPDSHINLLDNFAPNRLQQTKEHYKELYDELQSLRRKYDELSHNEQEVVQRIDLLTFQWQELNEANLEPKEDEQLEEERRQLMNYERIYEGLNTAYESLAAESHALDYLGHAMTALESLEDVNDEFKQLSQQLKTSYYSLEELSHDLRNRVDDLEFQPGRLDEIETRLFELNRLKRKYGLELNELMTRMAEMEEELEQLQNKDTHLQSLEKEIHEVQKDALTEAEHLHKLRQEIANDLSKAIQYELKDLYLEKAQFDVSFSTQSGPVAWRDQNIKLMKQGLDLVQFLITTNPGEPLKPLHKVASGGEISRIMLAIKSILSQHQGITSVIFDEVDTGVSGRVAQAIAQKIHGVSSQSQVLCITHLPQVASMADHHYLIEKDITEKGFTNTSVQKLDQQETIDEVGRMISGGELTETTTQHAEELIKQAASLKS